MSNAPKADPIAVLVDFVRVSGSVGNASGKPDLVVLRLCLDGCHDPIHGIDRVEVVRGNDQGTIGMLERCSKATANDISENVEDDDVRILEQMVFLEQLHRLANDVATAPVPAGGPPASTHMTPL